MRRFAIGFSAAFLLLTLTGCLTTGESAEDQVIPTGMVLYTQLNMWSYGNEIHTVNYSVERKIQVNTEVEIISVNGSYIYFHTTSSPETRLVIANREDYSGLSTNDLVGRYFAAEPRDLSVFNDVDQAFIKGFNGYYHPGVSKEAMLVGRGYPPIHRTPSTNEDVWIYWRNKWKSLTIEFVDGVAVYRNGNTIQPR